MSEAAIGRAAAKRSAGAPLAIIGMGCLFPKAGGLAEYWANILNRVDAITDVPATHWRAEDYYDADPKSPDHVYAAKGGFLSPVDFNPMKYGILPNAIEATDTSQLLALATAEAALDNAGYGSAGRDFNRDRVSVLLGVTGTLPLVIPLGARLGHPIWRESLRDAGVDETVAADVMQRIADSYVPWQENSFPGLLGNVVAGRVAKSLSLSGTNCAVDAACASAFSALHLAELELARGQADMVVTGGVDTFNDIFMYTCFSKTPALSPQGHARPFDAAADGTTLGEGLGIIVLKRLEDAERDGDRIYAVVRGLGTSSDGREEAIYAPSPAGQMKALRRAYENAGITPDTVELVEAHGTGTKAGDAAELAALKNVYGDFARNGAWCALGSVKSQIGHTKAAAGAAGLIKAVMAVYNKVLPPTIKVTQPAKEVAPGQGAFYVNTEKRPWLPRKGHPRRAAVSSFGFGGSNYHCVIEEHRAEKTAPDWDGDVPIFAVSGATAQEVLGALRAFPGEAAWSDVRHAAARSRAAFRSEDPFRLVIVLERGGADWPGAVAKAEALMAAHAGPGAWAADNVFYGCGPATGKLALMFPGQGAQRTGMFRDLVCVFPEMLNALEEADVAYASAHEGASDCHRLSDSIYPQPAFDKDAAAAQETALRNTQTAQPAIGGVSVGVFDVLRSFGVKPDAVAGHSYGELVALYAAGRIDREALHALSCLRGRLMGEGSGDRGTMLAVRASEEQLAAILAEDNLNVTLANKNAPAQTVLSGASDEIDRAAQALKGRGIRGTRLNVAAAFHSAFVADAATPLREALESVTFHDAAIPVYANTSAAPYPADASEARDLFAHQLARPVEFVREIDAMHADGVRTFVEAGPGSVLTGLIGAILPGKEFHAFSVDASGGKRSGMLDLGCTLGRLAALGYKVRLEAWDADAARIPDEPEDKKPALTISICGANYVKPREKRPPTIRPASGAAPIPTAAVGDALAAMQQNFEALRRMQEQTARLHHQFLESQESAARILQELVEQQRRIFEGGGVSLSAPSLPPRPVSLERLPERPPVAMETPKPAAEVEQPKAAAAGSREVARVLLEVVAEKTGYPLEMLSPEMQLDADLGIDSIKRVEILSALQERVPGLPAIEPDDMGRLRTLRDVAAFMGETSLEAAPGAAPETANAWDEVAKVLVAVVSEKTGYPIELLDLSMGMDSDLGIDSIKRVEILSTLQERLPELPQVQPEELSKSQSLRDVIDLLCGSSVPAVKPVAPVPAEKSDPPALHVGALEAVALDDAPVQIEVAAGSVIWLLDGGAALGGEIASVLTDKGYAVERVALDKISGAKIPARIGGLIIVAPDLVSDAFLKASFLLAQRAGGALRAADKGGAILVTVSRMDGAFGVQPGSTIHEPLAGGLAGLVKTAAAEWPEVHCKAIDIAPDFGDDAACAIVEEAFRSGERETGLSREGRKVLRLFSVPAVGAAQGHVLAEGDLVVISGGARGVTAEVAVALARAYRPSLLLLGRSAPPEDEPAWLAALNREAEIKSALAKEMGAKAAPKELEARYRRVMANREVTRTLERVRAAGGRAWYAPVDIRDAEAVAAAVARARAEAGPVRALVHGAGVLADKFIADKTPEDFDKVYDTKVQGWRAMLAAAGADELKLIAMFSSSTARFGRAGQVDYAMANEALNKLAQAEARRRPACRVVSINWGPWAGGMVTPALQKVFAQEGLDAIALDAGAELFVREVSRPPGTSVEVVVLAGRDVAHLLHLPRALPEALSFDLDLARNKFLKSHVIDGRAVAPLAAIIEWLGHGALHGNPGFRFIGFDDLRELKGVTVTPGQARRLRVHAGKAKKAGDVYHVDAELRGVDDAGRETLHARMIAVLGTFPTDRPKARGAQALPPSARGIDEVYAERILFHGPDLRGISSIEGVSDGGISVVARCAPSPRAWTEDPLRSSWLADPLAIDCAFQAMLVWVFEKRGASSLPVYVKRYRQFGPSYPASGVRIEARAGLETRHRVLADIEFIDRGTGELVAQMDGCECVVDASLHAKFRRNELPA